MVNINTLSYLIASLDSIIQNFGVNQKSIQFFKDQTSNLVRIGQIAQEDVDIIYRLLNFSYITDKDKWAQECKKKEFFVTTVNRVLSYANNPQVLEYILQQITTEPYYKENEKAFEKVLRIVAEIFNVQISTNISNIQQVNGFGTSEFVAVNTGTGKGKQAVSIGTGRSNSISVLDGAHVIKSGCGDISFVKKYDLNTWMQAAYDDLAAIQCAKSKSIVRVKNLNAVCTNDPTYYTYKVREVFYDKDLALKILLSYQKGASVQVGQNTTSGDACRSSTIFTENEQGTTLFKAFLVILQAKLQENK